MESYITPNVISDKRSGAFLLLCVHDDQVSAFGLSIKDAIRAQENGVKWLPVPSAKKHVELVE